jgi:hypothetical protein
MHVPLCFPSFTYTHAEMDKTLDKKKEGKRWNSCEFNTKCVIYKIGVCKVSPN